MSAYYNEHDPFAAAWLRELIADGLIAPGEVDERSIEDVLPSDLAGFVQCHFFAGIGVWSYALRRAGIPDDCPVWTASCPCQPFSAAGEGKGFADERHLWPAFYHLASQRQPSIILGEQVASKDGYHWLDLVQTDLEAMGHAFGPVVLPAAGFGAPHGRHRTFFVSVAHPLPTGWAEGRPWAGRGSLAGGGQLGGLGDAPSSGRARGSRAGGSDGPQASHDSLSGELGHADKQGSQGRTGVSERSDQQPVGQTGLGSRADDVANADLPGQDERPSGGQQSVRDEHNGCFGALEHSESQQARVSRFARERRATSGYWGNADWIPCRSGKWRAIEPGTFPLAHGAPARMGRLRGYGNAINAEVAAAFIEEAFEAIAELQAERLAA